MEGYFELKILAIESGVLMYCLKVIVFTLLCTLSTATAQVTFLESAYQLNMGEQDFSSGVSIVDFNNDATNEVFIVNCFNQNRFYILQGSTYIEQAQEYGLQYTNDFHDVSMVDVNFDWLPDFYVTGCYYNGCDGRFFVNRSPGAFEEMAHLYNLDQVTDMSATFFQMTPSSGLCVLAGRHLKNLQFGTFIDITQGSGLEGLSNVFCPVFFDIDGDYDDDLFIAGNWELNYGTLFRNNNDGTFTDISTNTDEHGFGFGQEVTYGDIDNDGDFDIYLCSGFGTNTMWQNDGTGYFSNFTEISNTGCGGYSRGANFADFDNDCDLDLFVNRASDYKMLYLNDGAGVFVDYSQEAGISEQAGGFGCAVGDLDGDGQMDIIAANSDFVTKQVYVNLNEYPSFLKIKVVGHPPNTLAIGAIIDVYSAAGPTLSRTFIGRREISSHPSLYCVNDPVAHFGTGEFSDLEVIIHFQSLAIKDTLGIAPGQTITIEEPSPTEVENPAPILPQQGVLLSAYPNPFNNTIEIGISGGIGEYYLTFYDILARRLKSVAFTNAHGGFAFYVWDGTDDNGFQLPSGVYFLNVQSGKSSSRLKIILLR